MRKFQLKTLFASISLLVFSVAAILPADANANSTEKISAKSAPLSAIMAEIPDTVNNTPEGIEYAETENLTADELEQKFLGMLNINYCYDFSFDEINTIVNCAALSLYDYAYDSPSYGICVNSNLIAGFTKSFYGVEMNADDFASENSPEGYISLAETEACTIFHKLVSITETDKGYEVLTCMETYYGGDDVETCLVKSTFVKNALSEFGFNLLYAETL